MNRKRKDYGPGEALSHVLYEIAMLFECVQQRLAKQPKQGFEMSSRIEAFVVHARCLGEFFYDDKEKKKYMKPHHFFKEFQFPKKRYTESDRMNTEVAHLTYGRTHDPNEKRWDYLKTVQPLAEQILDFLSAVRSDSNQMAYMGYNGGKSNLVETDRLIQLAKLFASKRSAAPKIEITTTDTTDSGGIESDPTTSSSSGVMEI